MLGDLALERLDVRARNEREITEVLANVAVLHVQPELVEPIGRGARRVEPDGACLGFSELRTSCGSDEREGQPIDCCAGRAPNELDAGRHVSPLIAAADL